jgi:hypothetical protein
MERSLKEENMKVRFVYGTKVRHMTDPHGRNQGTVRGVVLRGGSNLCIVVWESGATEFVHESELKEA